MSIDSRFNRILNSLDKPSQESGQPKITELDKARWATERVNGWLDKGELVEIKGDRLKLIGD